MWKLKAPGIKSNKREQYERVKKLMWLKCIVCGKLVYYKDYKENLYICPKCGHVFPMTPKQRWTMFFDNASWEKLNLPIASDDPLEFCDRIPYAERLETMRADTGYNDALSAATGKIGGISATLAVMNPEFMMGSMGRSVGDGIIASIEHAIEHKQPYIMITTSGGARMQENILALMQMARTTAAVNKLHAAGLPYVVILADPTFGGVTASFAMLGDIHIAESGARIGFAGRRVIEQNMRSTLPNDFQTANYLLEHGMVDMVTPRKELKETLIRILSVLMKQPPEKEIEPISVETPKIVVSNKSKGRKKKIETSDAYEKVLLARNENRPHFLDYVAGLTTDWTPLSGDRLFGEDPALQGGLCYFRGIPAVLIGQEKGRDIATRQKYRFGMPNPEGYRKAQRMMRLAEKFDLPLISLFDTSGAFAGREGEERGQSAAVATTIAAGLKMRAPYIAANVGEGGSGGAIAIATGDRVLMMENAIYSVIAPESCATILWRDNKYKSDAAAAMKLTANDLAAVGAIDEIIKEPGKGAHTDWQTTMELLGSAIVKNIAEVREIPTDELPGKRADKFFAMTRDVEIHQPENAQDDEV
ncbi:MAG: acetyl-CoA carboxylase, carboxyltransferase subunit beta [Rickettsiales bacterium]|jgi:acetyl-CoA carboxylase carboxyl transferase subunit beta|nr:acetyl-CoA carboxylase, carboxyltransferase subunit beta [Rickettsiales bacterium]